MLGRVLSLEMIALLLILVLSMREMLLILLCNKRDPFMCFEFASYYPENMFFGGKID